jgi:hypothetical protein
VKTFENANVSLNDDTAFTGPVQIGDKGQQGSTVNIEPGADVTVPGSTSVGEPGAPVLSSIEQRNTFSFAPDPGRLITPVLTMHGVMRPGGSGEAGAFNLTGDLSMYADGVLEIEIGGLIPEVEHDQSSITGSASLGGTLKVGLLPGFAPELGQSFEILLVTNAINGTFAAVSQPPNLPANLKFEPVYAANKVTLQVVASCYSDCDADGALTIDDFICFQTYFALGDPIADCDADGVLTIDDFICFQTFFALGC